ncbi:HlyD family efflux transporter periplasmic adaptor subunit [Methyloceanibacter sp.]|uniref:HlyD family secretion protein n=1 Tax=Methyloceanibacter sp. TaxID=1965321 RepID=UPI002BA8D217|nr:HlyD family efflux transporter periplasmic adaptor subunit [Methyloceanibacter sp.]HML93055.1 HlyD family efflux transporter periplasmic adaptor subunit [Methyloceanibacter sp.]
MGKDPRDSGNLAARLDMETPDIAALKATLTAAERAEVKRFEDELFRDGDDADAKPTAEVFDLDLRDALDAAGPVARGASSGEAGGAGALQALLTEQVHAWDWHPVPEPDDPAEIPLPDGAPPEGAEPGDASQSKASQGGAASGGTLWWRLFKTAVALAAVIGLGWTPLQRFLQNTSAEATVNARLVTLRAPIAGTVHLADPGERVGAEIEAGTPLLTIENPREDRTQLDTLRRDISGLESEREALGRRKAQLQGLQGSLREQRDAFQAGRVAQLEARIASLKAEIAAADAKESETKSALARSRSLKAQGWQTEAALETAEREHKVALNTEESLRQRMVATKVELDAARRGLFVGDSYNDIPRTAQRLDEVTQQIIGLDTDIEQKTQRIAQLRSEFSLEQKRYDVRSRAALNAPVPGRIWEVLTANGEQVFHGQDLMRVLDCAGVRVTAAVSESVYNALRIGQPATFHLRGGSEELEGRVTGLHGLAAVPGNWAIGQTALAREPYHVTVEVPNLANGPDCHVGRTGKVTFNTATGPVTAAAR